MAEQTDHVAPPPTLDPISAQCPACGLHELVPVYLRRKKDEVGLWEQVENVDDLDPDETRPVVQIDTCPVCFGAWFDAGELDILARGEQAEVANALGDKRPSARVCVRGHGTMHERDFQAKRAIPVDQCETCDGIWLDGHERRKLAAASTQEGQQAKSQIWARRGAIWAVQLLTQLPVEVENPARGTPWVVYSILALLGIVFGMQIFHVIDVGDCLVFGRQQTDGVCLASVPGALRHQWKQEGANALLNGQFYTLATHAFLHGNWGHFLANAYFLYIFGDNVEHLFGRKRFIILFLLAGIAGGGAEVLFATNQHTAVPIVGASGSIAGVMAAYLWAFPRNKLFQVILFVQVKLPAWVYLFVWLGFQAAMGFFGTGEHHVAWFSHMGGFAVGLIMAPLVLRQRRREVARSVKVPAPGPFSRG